MHIAYANETLKTQLRLFFVVQNEGKQITSLFNDLSPS